MLNDLNGVADLFVQQAVHIKNLDDPYCDNNAAVEYNELHANFKEQLLNLFHNPEALVVVSKENNHIVGFAIGTIASCRLPGFISKVEKVGYIEEAHVVQEHRRRGILKEMEKLLINFFRENKIDYVELNYFSSNNSAKDSWKALDYKTYMEYARKRI